MRRTGDSVVSSRTLWAANFADADESTKVDKMTHNLSRMVRLYGSLNAKGMHTEQRPHRCSRLLEVSEESVPITASQLRAVVDELKPSAPTPAVSKNTRGRTSSSVSKDRAQHGSLDKYAPEEQHEILTAALAHIAPDDYDIWLRVGMALHHWGGEGAYELWEQWSRGTEDAPCESFEEGACEAKWDSFGSRDNGDAVTVGSIIQMAKDAGWDAKAT